MSVSVAVAVSGGPLVIVQTADKVATPLQYRGCYRGTVAVAVCVCVTGNDCANVTRKAVVSFEMACLHCLGMMVKMKGAAELVVCTKIKPACAGENVKRGESEIGVGF